MSPSSTMCNRSIRVLAFLSTFAGLCYGAPPSGGIKDDSLALRVMTFNVRYGTANDGEDHWEKRKTMVFKLLEHHSPDIVGVQEAQRFQLDAICKVIPHYTEVGVGRDDGKTAGEYSAILFRTDRFRVIEEETFWFSDTPDIPGSMTWGNTYPRICTWARLSEKSTGFTFYVYNVHLDHISQPSREKSVDALLQKIRDRKYADPVIVTGDFNAGEQNPVILSITGSDSLKSHSPGGVWHLVDSYRSVHPVETAVGTFHAFNGGRGGEKIDFVFVEPDTRVIDAAILHDNVNGHYPSDHFPVTARILLQKR